MISKTVLVIYNFIRNFLILIFVSIWLIFTACISFIYGDAVDLFQYFAVNIPLFYLLSKFFKSTGSVIPKISFFGAINIVYFNSLNRISGYPDKELWGVLYIIALFAFILFLAGIIIKGILFKEFKKYVLMVIVNLILICIPITFLFPGTLLRQIAGNYLVYETKDDMQKHDPVKILRISI